jgi:MoaA/NifB/PqqE/SkfB family radical SAM enzyme
MPEHAGKWQRSRIRANIEKYRQAQEEYYSKDKPYFINARGEKVFSLISPPFGSLVARRRVRLIQDNILDNRTKVAADGQTLWGLRTPHVVSMAVTYDCQCQCDHCSAFDYRRRLSREQNQLTLAEWKRTIDEAVAMGTTCVVLTGGEPLLMNGLYELIEGIDTAKCLCIMFTNGALLDEEVVSRLRQAGLFGAFVSIDSSDAGEHDRNRRLPGLFQQAVRGIGLLQKAGIATGISTFVSREKMAAGEIGRLMDLAKSLRVVEVFLLDQIPTGSLKNDPECGLTIADSRQLNQIRESYKSRPDYPRIIHQTLFASLTYPCQAEEGCPAGLVTMHIRGNGDVTPCDFTPLAVGNIRERSLKEIWESFKESPIYSIPSKCCRYQQEEFRKYLAAACANA